MRYTVFLFTTTLLVALFCPYPRFLCLISPSTLPASALLPLPRIASRAAMRFRIKRVLDITAISAR